MKQSASSGQTFLYKYIYSGAMIGGAGWCGLMDDCACLPVLFWLPVLAIFFYKTTGSLKKVEYDQTSLYISNYITAIKIEKKDIKAVISGRFFFIPELIWLVFRKPAKFGDKVMFMPQERFKMFPTLPHPVVWELKEDITEVRRNFFFYVLELRSLESGGSGTDTRGLWPGVEPAAGGCERRRHAHHRRGMDAELRGGPVGNAGPHPGPVTASSHRDPIQRR